MRKTILGLAALAVIATPLVGTAANASTYNATNDGVITGYVTKGEVQSALGWNDHKVQDPKVNPVNFTTTFSSTTDKSWTCTNGEVRHNVQTVGFNTMIVTASTVFKSNGKIDGWNLTDMGSLSDMTVTKSGHAWLDCAGAGSVNYNTMLTTQSHAVGSDLKVNGVLLLQTV